MAAFFNRLCHHHRRDTQTHTHTHEIDLKSIFCNLILYISLDQLSTGCHHKSIVTYSFLLNILTMYSTSYKFKFVLINISRYNYLAWKESCTNISQPSMTWPIYCLWEIIHPVQNATIYWLIQLYMSLINLYSLPANIMVMYLLAFAFLRIEVFHHGFSFAFYLK